MKEKAQVITNRILADLKEQDYADYTVGLYRQCYNGLQKYIEAESIEYYSADIGLEYIRHKFGISIEGLYGKHPINVRSTIRALQVLWDYSEYGTMVIKVRPGRKPFECPNGFKESYESFQKICRIRNYTPMGKTSIFSILKKFIIFMDDSGVASADKMTAEHIIQFLTSYSANSTRYIATIVSILRNYIAVLREEGYLDKDLAVCLPKIRIMRNGFIPSVWKQEDVHKLLGCIDRDNPEGKRDYAILLMVTRLGLRVGDIRGLKLSNINWNRKMISIIMQKTKQPLELPHFIVLCSVTRVPCHVERAIFLYSHITVYQGALTATPAGLRLDNPIFVVHFRTSTTPTYPNALLPGLNLLRKMLILLRILLSTETSASWRAYHLINYYLIL